MSQLIVKEQPRYSTLELLCPALANGKQSKRIKKQLHPLITMVALNCGLRFRESRKLAVISGAGIAGLAAAFELRARGFRVVIAEQREDFSRRFNVINLGREVLSFLEKFNLRKKFEAHVAARIKQHRDLLIGRTQVCRLEVTDVSQLQSDKSVSFPNAPGKYNVSRGGLQTFLTRNGLETDVSLFGKVTVKILARTHGGGVSQLKIADQIVHPDLFSVEVSQLEPDQSAPFQLENVNNLFKAPGIYSVSIGDLQNFLAENALEMGVNIFGNTSVDVLERTHEGGVSRVQIANHTVQPGVLLVAEGANPSTALKLEMRRKVVQDECTGENWIFGNLKYEGKETFVVSVVDTSQKGLRIANVIFNERGLVNVAVTSDRTLSKERIQQQILATVQQVYQIEQIAGTPPTEFLNVVTEPVHIANQIAVDFSKGNVCCIGDATCCGSPLAGSGGTRALITQPVIQFLERTHQNSDTLSEALALRWMGKSAGLKRKFLEAHAKERLSSGGNNR